MKDNTGEISLMIQLMSNEDEKLETLLKELGILSNEKEVAQRNNINNLFTQIHERNQTDTTTLSVSLAETDSETKDLTLDNTKYKRLKIKAENTFTDETINTYDVFVRQKFIEGEEYQELLFGNWEADYTGDSLPPNNYKFSIFVSMKQEANLRSYLGVDTIASLDPKPKIAIADTLLTKVFTGLSSARAKEVAAAINKYSNEYKINTEERMSHFLGQIGFESNGLKSLKENGGYKARTTVRVFPWASRGHWYQMAIFDERTKTYTYKDVNFDVNTCVVENNKNVRATRGTQSTFYTYNNEDQIRNAYGDYKKQVAGKNYAKFTNRTDITKANFKQKVKDRNYNSGKLRIKQEYLGKTKMFDVAYACRNGNDSISSGDGSRYLGIGFIQITGKDTYKAVYDERKKKYPSDTMSIETYMKKMGEDIDVAMEASLIYWEINKLNKLVTEGEPTDDSMKQVSGKINKGNEKKKANHECERLEKTKKAYAALKGKKYTEKKCK